MAVIRSLCRLTRRVLGQQAKPVEADSLFRLLPDKPVRRRMLLSYATGVYERLLRGEPLKRTHISPWRNFQITRTFLDLRFQVDVIRFDDHVNVPRGDYGVSEI